MYNNSMKLVIQIPCFNEQDSILKVLKSLPKKIDGIDKIYVVVLDDGSTDNTAKITNDSNEGKEIFIAKGTGFMQGIFVEYGITYDDDATEIRNGGFGSTTK